MFNKDTFRLIRKTLSRFLSLTMIVMIGTGFMMGVMSFPTIMRKSFDIFNDEYNFQDLQIYSQYGFCEDDYKALKYTEGVKNVFPSKMIDMEVSINDGDFVVGRICEADRLVNQFELLEGRLPENENECVILMGSGYSGVVSLYSHVRLNYDGDDLDEYLKNDDFLIVGKVNSPEYLSKVIGPSSYKNRELDTVIYVPNSNFVFKYYTTMYVTLDGSKDYLSYSREYNDYIDKAKLNVEDMAFEQQNVLKERIIKEYEDDIADAEKEFEEKKADGQKELDEAARKLNDANTQLVQYESELQILSSTISMLKNSINDNEDEIISSGNEVYDFITSNGINPDVLYTDEFQNYLNIALQEAQKQYNNLFYQVQKGRREYENGVKEYNEALITFNDEIAKAEIEIRKARQDLEELPKAEWIVLDRSGHYTSALYFNNVKQMEAIGYSMPVLFFLVAALVCLTTMKRLIDEQRGQIGIYTALGFSKAQIISKYVLYAFLASILGGVIGVVFGQLLFPPVLYTAWALMYNSPPIYLYWPLKYIIYTLSSFSILMCSVTALIVNNTLKDVPATLMRPKSPKNAKEILLEKISFIWERMSFTSKITARNIFRYKSRFFMTIIGVAGCTGLLVVGFGVKDSIEGLVEAQYGRIFGYNEQIYLENDHHLDENIKILEDDLNNLSVGSFMKYTTKVYFDNDDDTSYVIAIDPRDAYVLFDLRKTDKMTPIRLGNDGVVVSEKFAKNNNIRVGDYLIMESENGLKESFRVSDICEMYFEHYIFISSALYENTFEETKHNTVIGVDNTDLDSLKKDCELLEDYMSLTDFSSFIEQFNITIEALDLIILVIIITAGSLALVVVFNLTQVNVSERVREIASLKVLGFNDREVDLYIFKEILLLTVIGGLIGLPLGTIEHHFIMNIINMDNMMFGMRISLLSYALSFAITFIFTFIVLLQMRKPLKNINMIESLKSVE